MNIHPQIINQNNKPAFVVLPIKEYTKMIQSVEELNDLQTIEEYLDNPTETFPLELVEKIADGENPIKVFRTYRKLSQTLLAEEAGISKQYISQIEKGERVGSAKILKLISKVLNVSLDDLV